MKVTVITPSGDAEERDYRDMLAITIDGKPAASFHDGEPEDATLARDFNDVYAIPALMQQAWEAGKRGEPFEVTSETEEW